MLASLPPDDLERIAVKLVEVELRFEQVIYEYGDQIEHVYFPNSGVVSIRAELNSQRSLEVGLIGREGMVGLPLALGVSRFYSNSVVQAGGTAMRMSAADFELENATSDDFHRTLLRFTHSKMFQMSQSAVCSRFHEIDLRLARWLLMTSDRMETNDLTVTQDFLSNMLGVRREAVNRAVGRLQTKGLVSTGHGRIMIVDLHGLADSACECYRLVNEEAAVYPTLP